LAINIQGDSFKDGSGPTGTPNYLPPEVLRESLYSRKGDIWALGVILYALTYGEPPFDVAFAKQE
jgi:serine/threonine protein kinase